MAYDTAAKREAYAKATLANLDKMNTPDGKLFLLSNAFNMLYFDGTLSALDLANASRAKAHRVVQTFADDPGGALDFDPHLAEQASKLGHHNAGRALHLVQKLNEYKCLTCNGTGAVDTPTSADDPSCPDCDGTGIAPPSRV